MKMPRSPANPVIPPTQLIDDLVKHGISQNEIAKLINVPQPTINRVVHGGSCNLNVYKAIVDLHREQFSESPAQGRIRRERIERIEREQLEARIRAEIAAEQSARSTPASSQQPETATE